MYKNIEKRKENLTKIFEIADDMFDCFLSKTQRQYENGSLYLITEVELSNELENYIEMSCKEFELFCDTTLKTVIKFLGDNLAQINIFESYSIDEEFNHSSSGKIKSISLKVKATLKS